MSQINIISPINQLGYGKFAFNVLKASDELGLEPALFSLDNPQSDKQDIVNRSVERSTLYNPDAPCLRIYHPFDMSFFVGRKERIGYTFFEPSLLKENEIHQLKSLDRVAISSRWAKEVLVNNGIPEGMISISEPGVDREIYNESIVAGDLQKPSKNTTVFMHVSKCEYRKGLDLILKSFEAAFTEDDDVLLIMHIFNPLIFQGYNGPAETNEWARYYLTSKLGKAGKIRVTNERFPDSKTLASFVAGCDCGFFPSRAEGWNMNLLEFMSMGKQVITTNYSAHTQFANKDNSFLIDITEEEEAYDGFFFHGHGLWAKLAEPQIEQAVEHLRYIHKTKQEGNLYGNIMGIETAKKLTWSKTVKRLLDDKV